VRSYRQSASPKLDLTILPQEIQKKSTAELLNSFRYRKTSSRQRSWQPHHCRLPSVYPPQKRLDPNSSCTSVKAVNALRLCISIPNRETGMPENARCNASLYRRIHSKNEHWRNRSEIPLSPQPRPWCLRSRSTHHERLLFHLRRIGQDQRHSCCTCEGARCVTSGKGSNPTFAAGAQLDRLATAARP
jgi:hypothetical protein